MDKITEILVNISNNFNALAKELEKQHEEIDSRLDVLEYQNAKNKTTLKSIAHTILNELED